MMLKVLTQELQNYSISGDCRYPQHLTKFNGAGLETFHDHCNIYYKITHHKTEMILESSPENSPQSASSPCRRTLPIDCAQDLLVCEGSAGLGPVGRDRLTDPVATPSSVFHRPLSQSQTHSTTDLVHFHPNVTRCVSAQSQLSTGLASVSLVQPWLEDCRSAISLGSSHFNTGDVADDRVGGANSPGAGVASSAGHSDMMFSYNPHQLSSCLDNNGLALYAHSGGYPHSRGYPHSGGYPHLGRFESSDDEVCRLLLSSQETAAGFVKTRTSLGRRWGRSCFTSPVRFIDDTSKVEANCLHLSRRRCLMSRDEEGEEELDVCPQSAAKRVKYASSVQSACPASTVPRPSLNFDKMQKNTLLRKRHLRTPHSKTKVSRSKSVQHATTS